jgi:hypothetical protein
MDVVAGRVIAGFDDLSRRCALRWSSRPSLCKIPLRLNLVTKHRLSRYPPGRFWAFLSATARGRARSSHLKIIRRRCPIALRSAKRRSIREAAEPVDKARVDRSRVDRGLRTGAVAPSGLWELAAPSKRWTVIRTACDRRQVVPVLRLAPWRGDDSGARSGRRTVYPRRPSRCRPQQSLESRSGSAYSRWRLHLGGTSHGDRRHPRLGRAHCVARLRVSRARNRR